MSAVPINNDTAVVDDIKDSRTSAMKSLLPLPENRFTWEKNLTNTLQGSVKVAKCTKSNELYAVKISNSQLALRRRSSTGKRVTENVFREWAVMKSLPAHDNIVALHEAYADDNKIFLVMDYCQKGELYDMIERQRNTPEEDVKEYFKQILNGLIHLHENNVVHLDMSLENVFVTEDNKLKIGDFGVARECKGEDGDMFVSTMACRPGKTNYMAPEVLGCQEYRGKLADVFSLGVMLFTMLYGFPPFEEASLTDARYRFISKGDLKGLLKEWKLENRVTEEAVDLLNKMLALERNRITLAEIKNHNWLAKQ